MILSWKFTFKLWVCWREASSSKVTGHQPKCLQKMFWGRPFLQFPNASKHSFNSISGQLLLGAGLKGYLTNKLAPKVAFKQCLKWTLHLEVYRGIPKAAVERYFSKELNLNFKRQGTSSCNKIIEKNLWSF